MKNTLKIDDDLLFHSYIVFSERCELKNVKVKTPDIRLIKRNRLLSTLKKDMYSIGAELTFDDVETIYNDLYLYTHADEQVKQQHIADIKH